MMNEELRKAALEHLASAESDADDPDTIRYHQGQAIGYALLAVKAELGQIAAILDVKEFCSQG
jgi:hypothetical protein